MDALQAAVRDQRRALRARFRVLDAAYAGGHLTARELGEAMILEGIFALGTLGLLESARDAAPTRHHRQEGEPR